MLHQLKVAGITPLSTVDYPDLLSSVIYTQGCPLRCGYCHNPHLISAKSSADTITWDSVLSFLQQRIGFLQGVVFSGGEPTLQQGLPQALEAVKQLGFKVGLHTSGVYPDKLAAIIANIDWIGLDVKALPEDYASVCGRPGMAKAVDESISIMLSSKIDYEVRLTLHPLDIDEERIVRLLDRLYAMGVKVCVIQLARGGNTLNPVYHSIQKPFNLARIRQLVASFTNRFERVWIREN
jgi:pyruvate formate lyase activating enzyme